MYFHFSLAIKNAEDNGPTKKDPASSDLLCDGEQWVELNSIKNKIDDLLSLFICRPSLEEIRTWGKSFDKLMRSSGKEF